MVTLDIDSIIQILILSVISLQLFVLNKTFKADHERRKKQSTVEYINKIRRYYREVTNKLIDEFGDNAINLDQINATVRNDIKELLSVLEHMSTGVNTGVYDFEILNRMSGSFLVSRYHQLYPYISHAQRKNPTFYIEFDRLCKIIENKKKAKYESNEGNIKHSC